ncbi:MAG TPA: ribosome biogenesis GTPase Der [Terriglobia bacterium]|nr:ribosome biogenesis GTPase Der [Terriglobia bacterium]
MSKIHQLPRIVIVGRPNVGKSTLFNRICGRRRALVGDEPGMTRDRIYAPAEWMGSVFEVVDTGGMVPEDRGLIVSEIFRQAQVAIQGAAHLVLVVDGRTGVTPADEELAGLLRKTGKPLALVVNKIDSNSSSPLSADFYRLGIAALFPVSAEHGLGVDDLLEHVVRDLPPAHAEEEPAERPIRVAIIGRPNTGKSTLLNRLLKEERSIVTPEAGTTRDAVDAEVAIGGHRFRFIDTAGIRSKGKTKLLAEKLSVIQARKHLELSDVALLMIDAVEGVTALDTHIGGYAHESHRSVIIVVNKWDALSKNQSTMSEYTEEVRDRFKYLDYAPLIFISALKGQRLTKLVESIVEVAAARRQRVSTAEMNRFLETLNFDRAPSPQGKPLRLYYLTQAGTAPPTFIAFTNRPGKLYFSIERYLENRIRENFGFLGTPIVIKARQSK